MQIDLAVSKKITLPAGYKKTGVKQVFKALDYNCLFVGGCVRDVVLKHISSDIDIATPLLPQEVMDRLSKANIKAIATGIEHGTVTAVSHGVSMEITTLRRDVATDGRRAVVTFSTDWHEDAQRRDFTFNSLLMDLRGHIYDPTGQGLSDLNERRVAFIGDARARVREDYLRILRYFRFCARYDMAFDNDILDVFTQEVEGLERVSKERVTAEIFKILESDAPQKAVNMLASYPIFSWFGKSCAYLDHFCAVQKQYDAYSLIGRLFLICSGGSLAVKTHLSLSNRDVSTLSELSRFIGEYPHKTIDCFLYYYNHSTLTQGVIYLYASGSISKDTLAFILSEVKNWTAPIFPINGGMLIEEGYEPGARLGKALRHVEEWWVAEKFAPKRDACLYEAIKWFSKN